MFLFKRLELPVQQVVCVVIDGRRTEHVVPVVVLANLLEEFAVSLFRGLFSHRHPRYPTPVTSMPRTQGSQTCIRVRQPTEQGVL